MIDPNALAKGHNDALYTSNKRRYTRYRWPIISRYITSHSTVLDVGCGSGELLDVLIDKAVCVAGYDPSLDAVTRAKECISPTELTTDMRTLTTTYDVITCFHVLQYATNKHQLLDHIVDRLTPNGYVIIGVPKEKSLYNWLSGASFPADWEVIPKHPDLRLIRTYLGEPAYLSHQTSLHKTCIKWMIRGVERVLSLANSLSAKLPFMSFKNAKPSYIQSHTTLQLP